MNRVSNTLRLAAASLSIFALVVAGSAPVVNALDASKKDASSTPKESQFCTNLPNFETKIDANIASLKTKLAASRTQQDQKIAANRATEAQELSANRTKWDGLRQASFTKLEAKATTPAQQAAVATYESTVTNAVATRRAANDAARATFRAGVDAAISSKRATVDSQEATFMSAVKNAETTAEASCQATPSNGPAIRSTFQASLKSAREAYTTNRKQDQTVGAQIKQLAATRDASFKANEATFTTTVKAAATTLKSAFGKTNV